MYFALIKFNNSSVFTRRKGVSKCTICKTFLYITYYQDSWQSDKKVTMANISCKRKFDDPDSVREAEPFENDQCCILPGNLCFDFIYLYIEAYTKILMELYKYL